MIEGLSLSSGSIPLQKRCLPILDDSPPIIERKSSSRYLGITTLSMTWMTPLD